MHRLSAAFVLGYHGCSDVVAEGLLEGKPFKSSNNDYDWLGPGIYFWESNPKRALTFADEKRKRTGEKWTPSVVGAAINLGLCLDVTTEIGTEQLLTAHSLLSETLKIAKKPLPKNTGGVDLMLRHLDCAVVRQLHEIRKNAKLPPVDTVKGIFTEGAPLYENSGFRDKTHVQICVANPCVIRGVFRVQDTDLQSP